MHKFGMLATAAVVVGAVLMSTSAQAQTKPLEVWSPPQESERDPAKRLPQESVASPRQHTDVGYAGTQSHPQAQSNVQAPAQSVMQPSAPAYEENRSGFFIGAHAGKGWVYDDVDQTAIMGSVGYRWQAGPVTLIGIELAGGKLQDSGSVPPVEFGSIGVNARFNFGQGNPVHALVRSGYMSAEERMFGDRVDGGYLGLGLGVDFSRNFNMSLVYTHYLYFDDYYWDGGYYIDDINSAETLTLGVEARF